MYNTELALAFAKLLFKDPPAPLKKNIFNILKLLSRDENAEINEWNNERRWNEYVKGNKDVV